MKEQSAMTAYVAPMNQELEEQLRKMEREAVPERLLELARQLQDQPSKLASER